jgi:transposase
MTSLTYLPPVPPIMIFIIGGGKMPCHEGLDSLEDRLKQGPKSMIGNKGYRKYLKVANGAMVINKEKVEQEARFDGKWVLQTNTDLPSSDVALKYKELWQVEHVFRDIKSVLETRPIYHKCDETIRGHVFCSFLALVLRKKLDRRLESAGCCFEWGDIKQDLESLQETVIDDKGKRVAVRTQCHRDLRKNFQCRESNCTACSTRSLKF